MEKMETLPKSKFTMAGTENTGQYVGIADTARGTVAMREYRPGYFRIRVEPKSAKSAGIIGRVLTRAAGWKQPGDAQQNRFSTTTGQGGLQTVLKNAIAVLGVDKLKSTELDSKKALGYIASKSGVEVDPQDDRKKILAKITAAAQ